MRKMHSSVTVRFEINTDVVFDSLKEERRRMERKREGKINRTECGEENTENKERGERPCGEDA
jgi:hypothetical protein